MRNLLLNRSYIKSVVCKTEVFGNRLEIKLFVSKSPLVCCIWENAE
jgi:hypothetical protein